MSARKSDLDLPPLEPGDRGVVIGTFAAIGLTLLGVFLVLALGLAPTGCTISTPCDSTCGAGKRCVNGRCVPETERSDGLALALAAQDAFWRAAAAGRECAASLNRLAGAAERCADELTACRSARAVPVRGGSL